MFFSGTPVKRTDIIYKWILDGHREAVTAAPLYNCSFKHVRQYNMTVEASNLVPRANKGLSRCIWNLISVHPRKIIVL
ncbi:hypothetical protein LSH36_153g04000 [Paralvinella palmiformis]|uniref:Uncharacterized protein n=1 Tax=Paralvinella palmiformis TaxID=53620 RepID=A0AAD9N6Z3_9ANNE|nr:hypothetical protein LSH36_153g04000 [Paralvinella palmiformis]